MAAILGVDNDTNQLPLQQPQRTWNRRFRSEDCIRIRTDADKSRLVSEQKQNESWEYALGLIIIELGRRANNIRFVRTSQSSIDRIHANKLV